ncbi:hypothetical protein NA56DRAFT_646964, partial [Hyaloscypha hepaticicola]
MATSSHAEEHSKTQSNSDRSENNSQEPARAIVGARKPLVSEGGAANSSTSDNGRVISNQPVPVLPEDLCKAIHDQLKSMETLSELSKHQLIELSRIAKYVEISSTSKVEFIWSSVLQLAGLLFVVVFGVFAALAYNAADVANKQSFEANQLSLLSFCMSNPVSQISSFRLCMLANLAESIKDAAGGICFAVAQDGLGALNSLATAILGPSAIPTTVFSASTPPPTSTSTVASFSVSNSSVTSVPVPTQTSTGNTIILTGSPTSTSTATAVPAPTSSRHLSTPAIVGVVVGGLLLGASFCVSLCTWFVKFPRSRSSRLRGSPSRDLDGSGEYSYSRARGKSPGLI